MKLINNRFRVKEPIKYGRDSEAYIIKDLHDKEKTKVITIYKGCRHKKSIDYFIDEFKTLASVRHKSLLRLEKFDIIETINLKSSGSLDYYFVISEYLKGKRLSDIKGSLDLNTSLKIILDVMTVIDYLHFRGYIYKHVSPCNIYVNKDFQIKIKDLANISSDFEYARHDDLTEMFMAPEIFHSGSDLTKYVDYYSIGILMKYLLTEEFTLEDIDKDSFREDFNLGPIEKAFLISTIKNLTQKEAAFRDVRLEDHVENIKSVFKLDYDHDLVKEREHLVLDTKLIGRDEEVRYFLELDKYLQDANKKYSGALLTGKFGTGKSKFLKELAFRLKMLNRSVFHIKGMEDSISNSLDISSLLRETFKTAPNEIIHKYRDDFSEILNKESSHDLKYTALDEKTTQERYRIYNRVASYFADLSLEKSIYILIDNLDHAHNHFLNLINYLIFKLEKHRVFFIITSLDPVFIKDDSVKRKIISMIKNDDIMFIELENLNEKDCGKFIKSMMGVNIDSILGLDYIPQKFFSFTYRESLGNPNYITHIIKEMYRLGQLYMSEDGRWAIKETDYNQIAISIDENQAINEQVKNINPHEYRVLESIALSKDYSNRRLLMEILDLKEEDLNPIIESLINSKIIEETKDGSSDVLFINNRELKKIVDSRIDYNRKTQLRQKAVDAIIKLYKDDYRPIIQELTHHLANLGQLEEALDVLLEEAKRQDNKFSDYSLSLWEDAYFLVKDKENDKILSILDTLVSIYRIKGYTDIAIEHAVEMQDIAQEKDDLIYLVRAKNHKIGIYLIVNRLEMVEKLTGEIEYLIAQHPDLHEGRIILLTNKARLNLNLGRLDGIGSYLDEAIEISKTHEIHRHLGNIYNIYGLYMYYLGQPQEAIDYFNRSIRRFELENNIVEGIKSNNNIGNIYLNVYGQDAEALDYYEKGYRISSKYGFSRASSAFLSNIADIYFNRLSFKQALRYYERARDLADDIGDYKGTLISNLKLGLVYLRLDQNEKAHAVYKYITIIQDNEPIVDKGTLIVYHRFLGSFYYHFGKLDRALEHFKILAHITKGVTRQDHILARAKILIIQVLLNRDYNREKMDKILNDIQVFKMNNFNIETILRFATLALMHDDRAFAKKIINIVDRQGDLEKEDLRLLRDVVKTSIYPTIVRLRAMDKYKDKAASNETKLYASIKLAELWSAFGEISRSINYSINALDNILKRSQTIEDKDLRYHFIKRRKGDMVKDRLSKNIEIKFCKRIDYIGLEEAYREDISYNDLIRILIQLDPEEYQELKSLDHGYEKIDDLGDLLDNLTDDNQRNLDLILNYLGHGVLATRGFILTVNEEDNQHTIIASLREGDSTWPKMNILAQSNRSPVGILINRNLDKMEETNYIELLPEDTVSVICVPLFKEESVKEEYDRRKSNIQTRLRKHTSLIGNDRVYIYLESDSYLNKFDYDGLMLVWKLSSLILLNIENKYLKELTIIDKLTGLLTRKYFDQQLDRLIEGHNKYQGNFTLLMIDIDNFKVVNDTYGHLKGDEALGIIGNTLRSSVRSTDLVARYGGEEFIIVLYDTSLAEGFVIAEKIRRNISEISIPGIERDITVSIGLAQYPEHSQFKRELIRKADQALYNAKEIRGRNNTVIWNIDLDENTSDENELVGILTGNINRDNANLSAVIKTASLVEKSANDDQKIHEFISLILESLEGQYATLIRLREGDYPIYMTQIRKSKNWVKTPKLNKEFIDRVISNKKGEFFIDWDNTDTLDPITGEPQWQSVLILPLIRGEEVQGLIYLSVPLIEKEFSLEDLNLGRLLTNIFAANLSLTNNKEVDLEEEGVVWQ